MTKNFEILLNLRDVSNYHEAFSFLKIFENKLFIYSPFVGKVYLNYNFIFPTQEHNNIAVLPEYIDESNIIHGIPEKYVSEKPYLSIMPTEILGKSKGTVVKVLSNSNILSSKYIELDEKIFENIVHNLKKYYAEDFYPIIKTVGIRSFHNNLPVIDVYNLKLKDMCKAGIISELDKNMVGKYLLNGIKSVVNGV